MTASDENEDGLIKALRQAGLDSVAGAFAYGLGSDLHKANLGSRRRTRLEIVDGQGVTHELYLKRYGPDGFGKRLKRWVRWGGRSVARVEYEAIRLVGQAGVATMRAVTFGQESTLMSGRSYLVVTAVGGEALERAGAKFIEQYNDDAEMMAAFNSQLARLVGKLHRAGLVHRDLYASHIFLEQRDGRVHLALIDLARVFRPRWRTFRWRVKDLGALHYSMPTAWVAKHWLKFLTQYLEHADTKVAARWQRAIVRKSESIRRHTERRIARRAADGGEGKSAE